MKFFKFNEKENKIDFNREDILLVDCFDKLLKQDKTKDKSKFWAYCKYLYLVYDNDSFLVKAKKKLDERIENSKKYVNLTDNDLQNPLYLECEKEFKYWNYTKSMELRDSNLKSIDKLDSYSSDIDLNERIDSGAKKGELVHNPSTIAKIRKDILVLIKDTKELEQLIEIELEEKGKARGGLLSSPNESGHFRNKIDEHIKKGGLK